MQDKWKSLRVPEETKREVDILAAIDGKPVYLFVADMLSAWKQSRNIATVTTLPHPIDAQVVPVVSVQQGA